MSHHIFRTERQGARLQVTLGYQRRTCDYFLCVVPLDAQGRVDFPDDDESDEDSDAADVSLPIFVSERGSELNVFRETLNSLGLQVPETMFAAVENDKRHNAGNRVVNYAADGSDDQGPAYLRLGQYDSPLGLAEAFRLFYANGAIAIELSFDDGELTSVLSVNVADAPCSLGPGEFFVENWGTNEVLVAPALASGLFEDTGRTCPPIGTTGVCPPIWRIRQPAASAPEGSSST